ncbi:aldo/keto reductase, partial [Candidatus Poribacteria bacterium]
MRYQELGKTGMKVSILACGSNALRGYTYDEAKIALNRALDSGINLIETGRPYGDETEDRIAAAVSHRRDEFYLASKTSRKTAKEALQDVEKSLKVLRTDYIDLYQIAGVSKQEDVDRMMGPGGAMESLMKAKADGKIGHIGVTGHNLKVHASAIKKAEIETALFIFNMVYREALEELIPLAKRLGVGTMVMRPISHGELAPVTKSLAYVLTSGVDVTLCGMYSTAEVDENVAIANTDFTDPEIVSLQAEGLTLHNNGCDNSGVCSCPQGIDIPYLLKMTPYRDKYRLLEYGEKQWQKQAENARKCDDCKKCEEECPYH